MVDAMVGQVLDAVTASGEEANTIVVFTTDIGCSPAAGIDEMKAANKQNKRDTRYQQYMEQDDLNIEITAVCDIFDVYGEAAVLAGSNIHREGSDGKFGPAPKRYRTYQELVSQVRKQKFI